MLDATHQVALQTEAKVAPAAKAAPEMSPALRAAIRRQNVVLGLVVLKFGALLIGAMASRGWFG